MKYLFVCAVLAYFLLITGAVILAADVETAPQAAQATSTPTPESARPGYTNYSGYYRMRCWPACHTKDIPESIRKGTAPVTSRPAPETERGYTSYSGYYRMRCWPACHTKDLPESIK